MSQDKPVAAQEPIFWACYAKKKLVEVTNNTEYVHTFKCNFPLTHRIVPLYDHAVPCARCAELGKTVIEQGGNISKLEATIIQCGVEASELQAKITEQAEELRIIRANLAQLEKDFDRRNEVVDAQVERIKALEADLEREIIRLAACGSAALGYFEDCKDEYRSASLGDVLHLRDKLAKADAVILQMNGIVKEVREARYIILSPLQTFTAFQKNAAEKQEAIRVANRFSAAIEAYQKGE